MNFASKNEKSETKSKAKKLPSFKAWEGRWGITAICSTTLSFIPTNYVTESAP